MTEPADRDPLPAVRIMLVSSAERSEDPLGAAALARALEAEGHQVQRLWPEPRGKGRWSRLADLARFAGRVRTGPPADIALVFARTGVLAAVVGLAARRVPMVLLVPSSSDAPLPTGLRAAARSARAVVTLDPRMSARLAEELGIQGVGVLGGGFFDLSELPTGTAEQARDAIGLNPRQRFIALTGPLEASTRVDLLALAQRRLAGVGLLVIGTGAQDPLVAAMTAATRPSSPVLHIPTLDLEARRVAVQAADVVVALEPDRLTEDAVLAPALGRILVSLDHPGLARLDPLYPGLEAVIRVDEVTPAGLGRALERGLARAPLPVPSIEAARRSIDAGRPLPQLLEVLSRCASSC